MFVRKPLVTSLSQPQSKPSTSLTEIGYNLAVELARVRGKTERTQALAKPIALEMSQSYEALVAIMAQAHDHAQRQAVQASHIALTLRNWLIGYHMVHFTVLRTQITDASH
jgi:hypothetical protein